MKSLPDKNRVAHILLPLLALLSFAGQAADIENGKKLHQENCTRCHGSEVYLRQERMVNNLEQLKLRVRQCALAAELAWFEEEIDDVIIYLDKAFYKFTGE